MPKTLMAIRRIQQMHDEDNHERCDTRKCAKAAREFDEITITDDSYRRLCGLRAKALFDECEKQGLNFADYVDSVAEALADTASLDGEQPNIVSKLAARAEIKLTPH